MERISCGGDGWDCLSSSSCIRLSNRSHSAARGSDRAPPQTHSSCRGWWQVWFRGVQGCGCSKVQMSSSPDSSGILTCCRSGDGASSEGFSDLFPRPMQVSTGLLLVNTSGKWSEDEYKMNTAALSSWRTSRAETHHYPLICSCLLLLHPRVPSWLGPDSVASLVSLLFVMNLRQLQFHLPVTRKSYTQIKCGTTVQIKTQENEGKTERIQVSLLSVLRNIWPPNTLLARKHSSRCFTVPWQKPYSVTALSASHHCFYFLI